MAKALVVKESEKAVCLRALVETWGGQMKDLDVWFPRTWIANNGFPTNWALTRKFAEFKNVKEWHRFYVE
jgi:hypothetical protein